ncbi:MAG: hypothetical protein IJ800_07600 [Clostridia bacterium]|nr:hypothetical protein [Clostridia bacterium]
MEKNNKLWILIVTAVTLALLGVLTGIIISSVLKSGSDKSKEQTTKPNSPEVLEPYDNYADDIFDDIE